nr:hypothetical protein [Bradyrhizobium brasilense]
MAVENKTRYAMLLKPIFDSELEHLLIRQQLLDASRSEALSGHSLCLGNQ